MLPLCLAALMAPPADVYFEAPADRQFAKVLPGGITVLPNGRFLTPTGKRLWSGEDVWQVVVHPKGDCLIAIHTDRALADKPEAGFTVYTALDTDSPVRKDVSLAESAPAAVFTADGSKLVVSQGDASKLVVFNTSTWDKVQEIEIGNKGYINDLVLSQDGKLAYGVDVASQELVTFDLALGKAIHRAKAGRQPYAIAMTPDGKSLIVANIGIFDYSVIPKPEAGKGHPSGLQYPAFGFPSKEARDGVEREGRKIPGLGDARVPDAQSVWTYALTDPKAPLRSGAAKSGVLIHGLAEGGKSVGGSAPNALLAHRDRVYVANANNDTISVFRTQGLAPIQTIKLAPIPELSRYRGVIPTGMAISPDGSRLYVCESGLNSVAVVDTKSGKTLGRIPTGWFPMQVRLMPDGKRLAVATQKGLGRGPRGAKTPRGASDERLGLVDMPGMVDLLDIPSDAQLATLTKQVLTNNGLVPKTMRTQQSVLPMKAGKASEKVEYVVFITKENHTFDGIFGGLKGATTEADYAEFGINGWIREKGKSERMPIMPNHVRLAEQFGISDNFYMEPQASGDGHRWLVGVYPSLWTTRVFYAGWDFRLDDSQKGRLVSFGSDGSQIPEDYLENGSMWEHLERNKISFRNYGEGYELPRSVEDDPNSKTGTNYVVNHPMPKVLYDNTCFDFPAYNTNIPDIARADWFIEDIEKYRKANKGKMPRFINIAICNDHGAGARPDRGYPYVASYMADNDLALGRIVEYLTHQPEWKKMAIFVTQDDSGADDDIVDRHRSFVLAISPFAKRGHVSHDHTSIMSIIRSIYLMFGLGPNNLFDALATPLHDMFTDKPDYTPYKHVSVDPRVFKPEETFDPNDPGFKRRRSERPPKMDDPKFFEWLRNRGG